MSEKKRDERRAALRASRALARWRACRAQAEAAGQCRQGHPCMKDVDAELARRSVESVVWPAALNEAVIAGIRRIKDVASGRTAGLTENEFRAALE